MLDIINKNIIIVGEETIKKYNFEDILYPQITNNLLKVNDDKSWWKPSINGKKRIMLCGTHPIGTSNGYSKVVYYISKYLAKYEDIEFTVYGFQKISNTQGASIRDNIPSNVKLHDAYATENPKRNGFGELEIGEYIKKNPQDIIIIFNDSIITTSLVSNIMKECGDEKKHFKIISYMDQVYPYQKRKYIDFLNTFFDGIIAFTPYWKQVALNLGIRKDMPMFVFPHGFDENIYYQIPTDICRTYFNLEENDFLVLNLNRNQPRKRWDTTIIAWAEFVERHYQVNVKKITPPNKEYKVNKFTSRNIKLVIGTDMNGYWDLMDVLENEIRLRDVPYEYAKNTIHAVETPQQLSDRDINILYNACDVGLNTADGEGFGLCGFEGAALGKAQISANIGGMKEFLNDNISILVNPCMSIYLDNKSNSIGGKAELTNPRDYAEGFWKYFSNPDLVEKHGRRAREHILKNYRWEDLVNYFHKQIIPNL